MGTLWLNKCKKGKEKKHTHTHYPQLHYLLQPVVYNFSKPNSPFFQSHKLNNHNQYMYKIS